MLDEKNLCHNRINTDCTHISKITYFIYKPNNFKFSDRNMLKLIHNHVFNDLIERQIKKIVEPL